jgi:hypothetical protein
MAKVTLVFEDIPGEEGRCGVNISMEFEPAIKKDEDGTPAQHAALTALQHVKGEADEVWDEEIEEEA